MDRTLVIGGTGFVGSAVQGLIADSGRAALFAFTRHPDAPAVTAGLDEVEMDLLEPATWPDVTAYQSAIWVAGNADHTLAHADPLADLRMNTVTLLEFLSRWNGRLTFLSSAAVYFGLSGDIHENVDHVPSIEYGLSKLAAEQYARSALREGRLSGLWVHRLMYAFGPQEKSRRLLARCVRASTSGEVLTIQGGGRSYLNPLPVDFVAQVLVNSSGSLGSRPSGSETVTNLNHPERWTVLQVVEFLAGLAPFEYRVEEAGEAWPVTFWGDTKRLEPLLGDWGLQFPDVCTSLEAYRDSVLRRDAE